MEVSLYVIIATFERDPCSSFLNVKFMMSSQIFLCMSLFPSATLSCAVLCGAILTLSGGHMVGNKIKDVDEIRKVSSILQETLFWEVLAWKLAKWYLLSYKKWYWLRSYELWEQGWPTAKEKLNNGSCSTLKITKWVSTILVNNDSNFLCHYAMACCNSKQRRTVKWTKAWIYITEQ